MTRLWKLSGCTSRLLFSKYRLFSSVAEEVRDRLEYDLVIVGAGPAGLSAAIRFKQKCLESNVDLGVCVLEKGSEVGAHILSGNVFEPRSLKELLPDYEKRNAPLHTPAKRDEFYVLTQARAFRLPTPPQMHNKGNYVISLSELTRWLASEAEQLGVEIYPGFAAKSAVYDSKGKVCGVVTNDFGIAKDGNKKPSFQPGVEVRGKVTLLAEGCRGSISKEIMKRFGLQSNCDPQSYALGIKEVWRVPEEKHQAGLVVHTVGWPLDSRTYGGSFIYHMSESRIALGLVVSLDYENPYLSPYQELQKFKTHPKISKMLEGGEVIQYGARSLNEGGFQSIPKLAFPGGALIGCSAGFLNVPKIKGTHTAMKSGMLAAESAFEYLNGSKQYSEGEVELESYEHTLRNSWVYDELSRERNIRPGFRLGLLGGLTNAAIETYVFRGKSFWTLHLPYEANESLKPASSAKKIAYPKPDGKLTFDILTSVALSGTNHDHDQPPHLKVKDSKIVEEVNWRLYAGPESRYCPARVYEYVEDESGQPKLQINAQNCLHCKACDIKDPKQNIQWTVPEGGGGPKYTIM
ncbi:hypothetical protein GpartN1_g2416.t1 [Galdieria partita]|uniref:Electron transfer flavoprotein-ubiquinone oxidoreductase n=1 Tax=Galdieria partita TaxID=83374 RepID=A0A9C7PUB7_9RHOD|nr:hypothetical protein GpartN1_g2416.t1 [Galdieria partita]